LYQDTDIIKPPDLSELAEHRNKDTSLILISPFYIRSSIRTIKYCNIVTAEKHGKGNRNEKRGKNIPLVSYLFLDFLILTMKVGYL
jgi:hypothetical protein